MMYEIGERKKEKNKFSKKNRKKKTKEEFERKKEHMGAQKSNQYRPSPDVTSG